MRINTQYIASRAIEISKVSFSRGSGEKRLRGIQIHRRRTLAENHGDVATTGEWFEFISVILIYIRHINDQELSF